ncbi:MAG: chemotaxis protein CheW [Myxococcaceae bacterium]|jgi:purine-binding chemotaxis protein CheW|nr:chemotaxis protein CheW [Myxococcaceae bacterium]MCA3014991.1 chemotaxis protein CheW [Myxococcaceae bacterium]
MRHVVFRLEAFRYALPLGAVREVVVAPERWTRVPRAPRVVRGVMNLRGRVVPVVDLRELLDAPRPAAGGPGRVVLLDRGRAELGLLVSDVDGVEPLELAGPPPPRASLVVKGLARLGVLPVTVLDPDALDAAVARAFTNG